MEQTTRYAYEKKIDELKDENIELTNTLYEYKSACSEIYDSCIAIIKAGNSHGLNIGWIMEKIKRVWSPMP